MAYTNEENEYAISGTHTNEMKYNQQYAIRRTRTMVAWRMRTMVDNEAR